MIRLRGDMASPGYLALLVTLGVVTLCAAGPLVPLSQDPSRLLEIGQDGCSVGGVSYGPGEEFPGSNPCERCTCDSRGVRCAKQRCEPRPGCKALHRPDHCCPIYQCECEQEGRVYGNGEKLVDPQDPCRVCYCQGGEVVCRRIACFVRDDCRPRLVPGRCCPEYDNCPLRGVTTIPGMTPVPSLNTEDVGNSPVPSPPKENIKQEITIKEITPVSEIPVITEVKIKEILPSPSIEVAEYSSSKSPLIVREATSEKPATNEAESSSKAEGPIVVEVQPSSSSVSISSLPPEVSKKVVDSSETKTTNDSPPSKISLSTQDSINSDIYPSILTSVPTMGAPSVIPELVQVATATKAPIVEEEDPTLFDHNPAFPPIPDDLSVSGNHEDFLPDGDGFHLIMTQEVVSSPAPTFYREITQIPTEQTTNKLSEVTNFVSTISDSSVTNLESAATTEVTSTKGSSMLNLRSAIPTEILNVPSLVPEEITGELDDITEISTVTEDFTPVFTSIATEIIPQYDEKTTKQPESSVKLLATSTIVTTDSDITTRRPTETTVYFSSSHASQEQTTNSIPKSNVATEITAQTELSSLPIETSDQNPHESENIAKEKAATSTSKPVDKTVELYSTKIPLPIDSEVITVSKAIPSSSDNQSFENVETTEFILTSFASSESATDAVELIKISADPEKNAPIIEPVNRKNSNPLTDLINLVGDVASIGEHTDSPGIIRHVTTSTSISDSEELIPVNAGYKSKNNNWNVNSITETPMKTKNQAPINKQKVIEIEDDDNITDSPPPNDKVEPTTRRPIIDNVSDDMPENKTEKKDIEIITKSYVPTLNRRPTKVVMKKVNENPISEEKTTEAASVSGSSEIVTESVVDVSSEIGTTEESDMFPSEITESRVETSATSSTTH